MRTPDILCVLKYWVYIFIKQILWRNNILRLRNHESRNLHYEKPGSLQYYTFNLRKHAVKLNDSGCSELHMACKAGDLKMVKSITESWSSLCFVKDREGRTPLHMAAERGNVDMLKALLGVCPESVEEVNASGQTCLHTAIVHNKGKAVHFLLKWLGDSTHYAHLINGKDRDGNTALHIATSRKQLQTLKAFLTCHPSVNRMVDVNAANFGRVTALDILYLLPHSGKIDMEINKVLRRAGAVRARDLDYNNYDAADDSIMDWYKSSRIKTGRSLPKLHCPNPCNYLLLTATLLATITFHSAITFDSIFSKYKSNVAGATQMTRDNSITTRSFLLFNSTGFFTSIAIIIYLLREFPLKPWPQISVTTLFGSYMCLINALFPSLALPLLFLSIPFLLLAAVGKLDGFSRRTCLVSSRHSDPKEHPVARIYI